MADGAALLEIAGLRVGYGDDGDVLHGVDLALHHADRGRLLALLGPNGAGKSTLLRTVAGFLRPRAGTVRLEGLPIDGHDPSTIARCGVYLVPERRAVFPNLSVADNLRLATAAPERRWHDDLQAALELFPRLVERRSQLAGTMSGGEQQMLALARAFAARPRLLLLDEPSLGLAPKVVDEVFRVIDRFLAEGIAVVLVEQYVERALQVADDVVVLRHGTVDWSGPAEEANVEQLAERYLA
ncbi:MAG: ABC transporter ATP-binding protein [Actinomycetota bacterium]|nr:ABC transporter ATP-binding protein [Actinomycetota bacterium]